MVLAADYPFLDILWTMILFFVWVMWFWLLFSFLGDVFRRRDIGGGKKTLWVLFMIFAPFLGVFSYLLVNHDSMAERNLQSMKAQRAQMDEYVRSVGGGGAAAEIEKAKALLDSGAITQQEFEALKSKALSGS